MLADIVERLSNWKHASFRRDGSTLETMHEAAEEITTLRARVKELESGVWISVDTALPDDWQKVMLYAKGINKSNNIFAVCMFYKISNEFCQYDLEEDDTACQLLVYLIGNLYQIHQRTNK